MDRNVLNFHNLYRQQQPVKQFIGGQCQPPLLDHGGGREYSQPYQQLVGVGIGRKECLTGDLASVQLPPG